LDIEWRLSLPIISTWAFSAAVLAACLRHYLQPVSVLVFGELGLGETKTRDSKLETRLFKTRLETDKHVLYFPGE